MVTFWEKKKNGVTLLPPLRTIKEPVGHCNHSVPLQMLTTLPVYFIIEQNLISFPNLASILLLGPGTSWESSMPFHQLPVVWLARIFFCRLYIATQTESPRITITWQ